MEECTVWPAGTALRISRLFTCSWFLLWWEGHLHPLRLRAKPQQASVSTPFPSPHPIYQSHCPLPLSHTHLLLFLSPRCHAPLVQTALFPGLASGSSFSSLPLPPALLLSTPSPLPASLLSEPMSGSSDLLWGLGVGDNDLQNICGLSLNER